ncbi:PPIL2-like protein [Mya arenaria]|uniref:PPIL2-like protein n=1 Tax=Mya arenaria TaxID=6604 RepID=A0ABY7E4G6_MYAAR|nr:PPIL2-like protein [Mya arenaria]
MGKKQHQKDKLLSMQPFENPLCTKDGVIYDLMSIVPFLKKYGINPVTGDKLSAKELVRLNFHKNADDEDVSSKDPKNRLKTINAETRDVLATLEKEYKAPAHYSTGAVSASFTSTAMEPTTQHEAAIIDEDIIRYERLKKKGYVRLLTNRGPLNLELHCDMIQGGDPEGTGKGGESAWGGTFKDEFKPNLTHSGRGVLSMANSGPDTNKSQFFITFRSARHLDGKHTVFGRVVGGLETLDAMEKIEADKKDRPQKEIRIEATAVFVNPYEEVDEELANEREDELSRQAAAEAEKRKPKSRKEEPKIEHKVFSAGVGKYINPSTLKRKMAETEATVSSSEGTKKKVKTKTSLSDFSAW